MNDLGPQDTDEAAIRARLNQLAQEHSDLDAAVQALALAPLPDMMVIARLKRKKLALKDEIERLKDSLLPDIIA
ncbi:MAG: YdcH family protein [Phenylobacterium sp.]|uniref:YdcH family protein n=1 Tax=Phenylobacterium sp. TaxID=1871053 RepID=UPI00391A335B